MGSQHGQQPWHQPPVARDQPALSSGAPAAVAELYPRAPSLPGGLLGGATGFARRVAELAFQLLASTTASVPGRPDAFPDSRLAWPLNSSALPLTRCARSPMSAPFLALLMVVTVSYPATSRSTRPGGDTPVAHSTDSGSGSAFVGRARR